MVGVGKTDRIRCTRSERAGVCKTEKEGNDIEILIGNQRKTGYNVRNQKQEYSQMLKIIFGLTDVDKLIFNPDIYFNNTYEDEWLTDSLSKQMIEDVDQSTVIGPHLIDSPFLGPISPERLSGGVKTLILMNYDNDHIFNASACGDNCAKWILKIAEQKDLTIRLGYLMDFGEEPFEIEIQNLGIIVHDCKEYANAVLDNNLI